MHRSKSEDLDQSEARQRDLLDERHVRQRGPVERENASCQSGAQSGC
jgi:hypothetical protein